MQVGDPQEVNGIVSVFCQSKREPLLVGSTKSNMGHPEPASGLAALAKVSMTALLGALKIQNNHIPFPLHFFFLLQLNFLLILSDYFSSQSVSSCSECPHWKVGQETCCPSLFLTAAHCLSDLCKNHSFACLCSRNTKNCTIGDKDAHFHAISPGSHSWCCIRLFQWKETEVVVTKNEWGKTITLGEFAKKTNTY